jgi:maltose alpha-D-glucosyltransferase/alpha-amylase
VETWATEKKTPICALEHWKRAVSDAFLQGYREATAAIASVPHNPASMQTLLDLFTLERTLYELRYELDNRPAWLRIPLQGLAALTARPPTG